MKKIETNNGGVYVVDSPYWAGEHTFTHYSTVTSNEKMDFTDLWAVDIYKRSGLNPLEHHDRRYIWASDDAEHAAHIADVFINEGTKVMITHIVPLNDRLREPATF